MPRYVRRRTWWKRRQLVLAPGQLAHHPTEGLLGRGPSGDPSRWQNRRHRDRGIRMLLGALGERHLVEKGLDDKLWIIGGSIPAPDQEALKQVGLDGIFPAGARLEEIVDFINERCT